MGGGLVRENVAAWGVSPQQNQILQTPCKRAIELKRIRIELNGDLQAIPAKIMPINVCSISSNSCEGGDLVHGTVTYKRFFCLKRVNEVERKS